MTKVHLCQARVKRQQKSLWEDCLAKLEFPGVSAVTQFLLVNGDGQLTIYNGGVWDYRLNLDTSISVQSGTATFDFGSTA